MQPLISIQALGPRCQLNEMKQLALLLTCAEIRLEQRGYNVRVDVTRLTFNEVVIDTLVKLHTQAIDLRCSSTEPGTVEVEVRSLAKHRDFSRDTPEQTLFLDTPDQQMLSTPQH